MSGVIVKIENPPVVYGGRDTYRSVITALSRDESLVVWGASSAIVVFSKNGDSSLNLYQTVSMVLSREGCSGSIETLKEVK